MPDNTFDVLADLVHRVECKPGWGFRLVNEDGALRLILCSKSDADIRNEMKSCNNSQLEHYCSMNYQQQY